MAQCPGLWSPQYWARGPYLCCEEVTKYYVNIHNDLPNMFVLSLNFSLSLLIIHQGLFVKVSTRDCIQLGEQLLQLLLLFLFPFYNHEVKSAG